MRIILIRHAKEDELSSGSVRAMDIKGKSFKLFSSDAPIASATADLLWDGAGYEISELLKEIGDAESNGEAIARARSFIDMAEKAECDIIAVSHEAFLKLLFKELKRRGYLLRRTNIFKVDYLEKAVATKRGDHCGRCSQNCHLANPGCDIGREKALSRKDSI